MTKFEEYLNQLISTEEIRKMKNPVVYISKEDYRDYIIDYPELGTPTFKGVVIKSLY